MFDQDSPNLLCGINSARMRNNIPKGVLGTFETKLIANCENLAKWYAIVLIISAECAKISLILRESRRWRVGYAVGIQNEELQIIC